MEGSGPLQEDNEAAPDAQDHPLVSSKSSHAGQEEDMQEGHHPSQHPEADEKAAEHPPPA